MLTYDQLHDYQIKASAFQCSRWESMFWADCGLGKTIVTLTSIARLIGSCQLNAVLIVAPPRVCRLVWRQESEKWEHTRHLRFVSLMDTRDVRSRMLLIPADVYVINYEKLQWLSEALQTYFVAKKKPIPFQGIVWDEITKLKNSTTRRVKSLTKILPHTIWRAGLTATPASNGYKDLHGQYLVTDLGKRLGTSKTQFKQHFYYKDGPHKEIPFANAENEIKELIGDMTLEMSAEDYNPLPDLITNDIEVELPDSVRASYEKLEKEFFMELESGNDIEVFNTASLYNKCLQIANGAVILNPGEPQWEQVHDEKLDALHDLIEGTGNEPIFLAYNFRADAARIKERFKHLKPVNLTECKSERQLVDALDRWKSGDIKLMYAHPASCGHGIDGLQQSGHTLGWFGLNWSLDLYDQFNGRLRRQGMGAPVICNRILAKNTLDNLQSLRLIEKSNNQESLRHAIKRYREGKGV